MNFLRNRLVVLGLVLLGTLVLYLLLPSIRQDTMEPSIEAQRTGLVAVAAPPGSPALNVSVRTGQLPGDPPLFFREALPVDRDGQQILPKLWEIARLRGSKDGAESGGSPLAVHGVSGSQGCCASESLDERTLLHPFPHEEQRTATRLRSYSTSWYPELLCTAIQKNPGESTECINYVYVAPNQ
ncbi:hypothetical protein GOODEAATRI_030236 [Goodea atripinnis]|uniref:Uncharacterized protein n=1 Tax=Goodea atripinnis TaxID=208336 RepID=A0ABV0Q296_9TELE